jgi:hypothetical protein
MAQNRSLPFGHRWDDNGCAVRAKVLAFERAFVVLIACNSRLCPIHATLSALSMRAKCSAKIRSSFMIGGMILLVVATGIVASAIAGMLNDRRRLP